MGSPGRARQEEPRAGSVAGGRSATRAGLQSPRRDPNERGLETSKSSPRKGSQKSTSRLMAAECHINFRQERELQHENTPH